jgi:hypothetical protein
MPGLKLTCPQAQRLRHLRGPEWEALLGALIDAKLGHVWSWRMADCRAVCAGVQRVRNDVSLGVLIAASSLWMGFKADAPGWLNWALMLFGVWTIAAPFALGYRSTTNAMMNDVAAGAIVVAVAIVREVFTGRRARVLPV